MSKHMVQAGRSTLETLVKKPETGVVELVWNAFDEDATRVEIKATRDGSGMVSMVEVIDNGNGFNLERATTAFSTLGDSWKRAPGTLTHEKRREVHGRRGRGRYSAFSLGNAVAWHSTAEAIAGGLADVVVRGYRGDLQRVDIEARPASAVAPGTVVRIQEVTNEAVRAFDDADSLYRTLLTTFALHLDRHRDFTIIFQGQPIDPAAAIEEQQRIPLELPIGVGGEAWLEVIEWAIPEVKRKLYLMTGSGVIIDEMAPRVQAPGCAFTAYLQWSDMPSESTLLMADDEESPLGSVVTTARAVLKEHLSRSQRRREVAKIEQWRREGVYPYDEDPRDSGERASRAVFNAVAIAAAPTLEEAKSLRLKRMSLSLLRQTLESDPEALLPILQSMAGLPKPRIYELERLLKRVELTNLIELGSRVTARLDFLDALSDLLFEAESRRTLLERRQLHRILAVETWVFGEEWAVVGDDEDLNKVLVKHLAFLGADVETIQAKVNEGQVLLREDGSRAIPDLVLGRRMETCEDKSSMLVVELKRPNHKLTMADYHQVVSYASTITRDERFDRPGIVWDFWLVGNTAGHELDDIRIQSGKPEGLATDNGRYRVWVKTWAEVLAAARYRLQFVKQSLDHQADSGAAMADLRDKYAEYLPEVAPHVTEIVPDRDGGTAASA